MRDSKAGRVEMKKEYDELELEVIRFETEDVITDSARKGDEGEVITIGGGTGA